MTEPSFLGRWVRSYDEPVESGQVYRREDFPLTPARGRAAVEIRPDGTFVDARIGPIEGSPPTVGDWRSADGVNGEVRVHGESLLTFALEHMDDDSMRLVVSRPG